MNYNLLSCVIKEVANDSSILLLKYKDYIITNKFHLVGKEEDLDNYIKGNKYKKITEKQIKQFNNQKEILDEIDSLHRKDNFLKDFDKIINE